MKKTMIIMITFVFMACGVGKDINMDQEKNPKLVKHMVVTNEEQEYRRSFSGNVISETESSLSFRVDGTIEKRYFKLGDYVKKGDILAKLDDEIYKIEVENSQAQYEGAMGKVLEAQAQLESALASFNNAKNEFFRIESLYYEDNVSKSEYDAAKAERDIAEAQLAQFEAYKKSTKSNLKASKMQLAQSKLRLSHTNLIVPMDGYIISEERKTNETISLGTPVYVMSQGDKLKVEVNIPENLITLIKKGDEVEVEIGVISGKVYRGEVSELGLSSTKYAGSFPVKIKLFQEESLIKSGMSAKINFEFTNKDKKKIILPISAISQDSTGKEYVYLVSDIKEGVGVAKKVFVNLGKIYTEGAEILEGINSGDSIITSGMTQILDGQEVKIHLKEES